MWCTFDMHLRLYNEEQIKAITGHKTDSMVALYVVEAKQKEWTSATIRLMEQNCTTSLPESTQVIENADGPQAINLDTVKLGLKSVNYSLPK